MKNNNKAVVLALLIVVSTFSSSLVTVVSADPNVTLTIVTDRTELPAGEEIEYQVILENTGTDMLVFNLKLGIALPEEVSLVGSSVAPSSSPGGNVFNWTLPPLLHDESHVLTLTVGAGPLLQEGDVIAFSAVLRYWIDPEGGIQNWHYADSSPVVINSHVMHSIDLWDQATANRLVHATTSINIVPSTVVVGGVLKLTAYNADPIYLRSVRFHLGGDGGNIGTYYIGPGQVRGEGVIGPSETKTWEYNLSNVMVADSSAPGGHRYVNFTSIINGLIQSSSPIVAESWVTSYSVGCWISASLDLEVLTPPTITVEIDIKPGSYPNAFNQNEHGVIPVAVLGSEGLDVTSVNVDTLSLQGLTVKVVGRSSKLLAHYKDVNGDGLMDLVVQFTDSDGWIDVGSGLAVLTGELHDGTSIEGADSIIIT